MSPEAIRTSSLVMRKRESRSHGKVLVLQLQPPHVICQDQHWFSRHSTVCLSVFDGIAAQKDN
ncbi:unnamed protein product [Brassica oleracea var. botrytis]